MVEAIRYKSLLTMVKEEVYTTSDRALWLWEDSMNTFQSRNEKINIHEELKVNWDKPEEIFKRDVLERQQLAKRILKRLEEGDCPPTLGIYGGWGTGKTSLLNLMIQLNAPVSGGGISPIQLISIDAWKYESSEGLLLPVVVKLKKLAGDGDLPDVWRVIVKRALVTTALSVTDALLKKFLDLDRNRVKQTYEEVELRDKENDYKSVLQKWETQSDEIADTEDAFKELIRVIGEKQQCRNIVICIDNLDRCSPENVVRLLESVKVFFNVPGCNWVFAMDSEVIASYIDHKYEGTKMDGNSYLDKIIPEQYHLSLSPSMDKVNIVQWLRSVVNFGLDLDERKIPQLPRVLVPRRLIKSAAKLAEFKRLRGSGGLNVSDAMVFNLALLYHVWPDFYQRFSSTSDEHVRGILDHFFLTAIPAPSQPPVAGTAMPSALPLLKDYAEDQDLSYFLRTVFSAYPKSKDPFVDEIIHGFTGLRMVGLP
jgi:hypothetical protein